MAHTALEVDDNDTPNVRLIKTIARSNWARAMRAEDQIDKHFAAILASLDRIEKALEEFD